MRRQGHDTPLTNHISDVTKIAKVSMKHLLLHNQTKMELTGFLGQSILEHAAADGRRVVVAWGSQCRATFTDKPCLSSRTRRGRH